MTWEHPSNKDGGRWILSFDSSTQNLIDNSWLRLLMYCVGQHDMTVQGIVLNVRAAGHRINIWTSGIETKQSLTQYGQKLRLLLQIPASVKLEFKKHSDVETETYKAKSIVCC